MPERSYRPLAPWELLYEQTEPSLAFRAKTVGDVSEEAVRRALRDAGLTPEEADDIYALTALSSVDERFVMPPLQREEAIEPDREPELHKGMSGLGPTRRPVRGG